MDGYIHIKSVVDLASYAVVYTHDADHAAVIDMSMTS